MKKILSVLAALAVIGGSATCFGAGAISLNNFDVNNGNGNPVYYLTSGTAADAGCYIEIFGGADQANLVPIPSTQAGIGSVFALQQGMFDGGMGDVPGVADNAQGWFKAIAWKGGNGANDWQTAQWRIESAPWQQATGADTAGQTPTPATLNFPAGQVIVAIPEALVGSR